MQVLRNRRGFALIRLALAGDARATSTLWSNCHRQLLDLNSLRGAPPQGKARVCLRGGMLAVFFYQVFHSFPVAGEAMAFDGFLTCLPGVGNLPEGLPGVYVGDMHLHGGD